MLAVEQGAQVARPRQARGACGDSTQKTPLGSRCKSWEQTLRFCPVSHGCRAARSLPRAGFALMRFTVHASSVQAGKAAFGLSVYQWVSLGPGITSLLGLSDSKGKSSCSCVNINEWEQRELEETLLAEVKLLYMWCSCPTLRNTSGHLSWSWVSFQS